MAEIPVERKQGGGFPWWLIPLLLLLLLLPLLYFCNRSNVADNTNNNTNRANVGTTTNSDNRIGAVNTVTNATDANTGNSTVVVNNNSISNGGAVNAGSRAGDRSVIKDVNEFGGASDKISLVGRGFFANGVRVNRVLSDNVFTVKSGSGEMFVLLDDNLDSPGGKEGQIKMKPGQNVNLGGEFRNVPSGEVNAETKGGGLDGKEYAQMKGQKVYLHATSVSDAK